MNQIGKITIGIVTLMRTQRHGRGGERFAARGRTAPAAGNWQPSVGPLQLAEREQGAIVLGRQCGRVAGVGHDFVLADELAKWHEARGGVGEPRVRIAARHEAARSDHHDAQADAIADARIDGHQWTVTTSGRTSDNINLTSRSSRCPLRLTAERRCGCRSWMRVGNGRRDLAFCREGCPPLPDPSPERAGAFG